MQLLNLSTRTLKEEEEDDSPSVISSSHHKPLSSLPPTTHTNHTSNSPLWFVFSVYGWGWLRLLYAIYSQEMEDLHCTTRVCLDEIGLVCLMVSGLSLLLAMVGLLRWSSLLITPFLVTQSVWTGGLAGGLIYQSYTEFSNGSRLVHVYAFCLLSTTVMIGALIGIYLTLRSMDNIRRILMDKRKGRIGLFANPLFSPDSVNKIARDDSVMDGSMSLTEFKTPSSLIALFEDTHEVCISPIGVVSQYLDLVTSHI
ncbi:hypothetical protein PENTCL1PPCAC_22979 [Pristionchus entomophagus]|uniref:Uncharacterized protein n=1 Tax=Pristionchus entomophagus TaxID=358040 RepID=A0AAV5U316_9BILA|nr:hypothetical protein PENTCL1PPCAC_22979 [Pristionchus entomophagus]